MSSSGARWVLPKGHIEQGETPEFTARREVREEAAIEAQILSPLGIVDWPSNEKRKLVQFYLMRAQHSLPPQEARATRWLPFYDALNALTIAEARWLVHRAHSRLCTGEPESTRGAGLSSNATQTL